MNNQNLQTLIAELRRDEGVRYLPYLDTANPPNWTIGVGHNMDSKPLTIGWKPPLNDTQVNSLLGDDLEDVFHDLDRNLQWWRDLNDVRQRVIANLCFNMGITRLLGFVKALTAARQGKYDVSANELLNSTWATQVKGRAQRLADMMRKGV
jgi:lysozyme